MDIAIVVKTFGYTISDLHGPHLSVYLINIMVNTVYMYLYIGFEIIDSFMQSDR